MLQTQTRPKRLRIYSIQLRLACLQDLPLVQLQARLALAENL